MKVSEIPVGEGRTGSLEGTDIAVYNQGERLIVLDCTCTHMGCQVDWNNQDKTWDCPCHGSRFKPDGTVMTGPALDPLPKLDYTIENDEIKLSR